MGREHAWKQVQIPMEGLQAQQVMRLVVELELPGKASCTANLLSGISSVGVYSSVVLCSPAFAL